jgi:hypothetical protein
MCVCVKFKSQQTLPQVTLAFIFFGKHKTDHGLVVCASYPRRQRLDFSRRKCGIPFRSKESTENQSRKGTFCLFSTSAFLSWRLFLYIRMQLADQGFFGFIHLSCMQ